MRGVPLPRNCKIYTCFKLLRLGMFSLFQHKLTCYHHHMSTCYFLSLCSSINILLVMKLLQMSPLIMWSPIFYRCSTNVQSPGSLLDSTQRTRRCPSSKHIAIRTAKELCFFCSFIVCLLNNFISSGYCPCREYF